MSYNIIKALRVTADSMCNDRCPECNKEIEPLCSEEI